MRILIIAVAAFLSAGSPALAQTDTTEKAPPWNLYGDFSFLLNQAHFSNWSKGGESSVSGATYANMSADWSKDGHEWNSNLKLGYGLMKTEEYDFFKKSEDQINLESKYGCAVSPKFNITAMLNFKTQFTDGFKYPDDSTVISGFMSPGYLDLSLGIDYKPVDGLSIFFTPASGRIVFVMNQELADAGKYIPNPAKYDTLGNKIEDGANMRFEFGATFVAQYKQEIMENITVESKLKLFNNYTDDNPKNRGNIDVDWETKINLKVNSYISANIMVSMLYDHDTKLPIYEKVDGEKIQVGTGRRLQLKQLLGIGFSYKISNKKDKE